MGAVTLAAKLCASLGVPLKEFTGLMRVAYLKELRAKGMNLAQCAEHLNVSERTAKNLSKELRESFELPDVAHALPTRIEFMLWRTPMSAARLNQVLKDQSEEQVQEAIELLLEQERVEIDTRKATPVYRATQSVNSQLSTHWVKRVGGLNSLIDNLARTIALRFFEGDGEPVSEDRAFARTLSFYLTPGRLGELQRLFWETIVPKIAELDQASHEEQGAQAVKLTLFWASEPSDDDEEDEGSA